MLKNYRVNGTRLPTGDSPRHPSIPSATPLHLHTDARAAHLSGAKLKFVARQSDAYHEDLWDKLMNFYTLTLYGRCYSVLKGLTYNRCYRCDQSR